MSLVSLSANTERLIALHSKNPTATARYKSASIFASYYAVFPPSDMPYISLQRPSLSQFPLTTYPMLTPGGRHLTWAPLPSISATSVNAQPHSFPLAEPPANRVSMRLHDGDNEPEPILPRSEVPVAPTRPWSTPHIPKVATVTHFTPLFGM